MRVNANAINETADKRNATVSSDIDGALVMLRQRTRLFARLASLASERDDEMLVHPRDGAKNEQQIENENGKCVENIVISIILPHRFSQCIYGRQATYEHRGQEGLAVTHNPNELLSERVATEREESSSGG